MFNDGAFVEARKGPLRFRADSKINSLARVALEKEINSLTRRKPSAKRNPHLMICLLITYTLPLGEAIYWPEPWQIKVADGNNLSRDEDWLDEEGCAKKLGFTPINKIQILNEMQQRFGDSFNKHESESLNWQQKYQG